MNLETAVDLMIREKRIEEPEADIHLPSWPCYLCILTTVAVAVGMGYLASQYI